MISRRSNIDSPANPGIKRIQRLQQKPDKRVWIIEGWRLLKEALDSGIELQEVYITRETSEQGTNSLLIEKAACPIFVLPQRLMNKISTLESPPGVLAVGLAPAGPGDLAAGRFGICLLSIRDPGNFGTILRTAEAAGCDRIFYSSDCVSPHLSKVVRASMGSIFRVRLDEVADLNSTLEGFAKQGVHLYALSADAAQNLFDVTPRTPSMILIGSETQGLPENLPAGVAGVSIPMAGRVESLNAAMAATVALYHFSRFVTR